MSLSVSCQNMQVSELAMLNCQLITVHAARSWFHTVIVFTPLQNPSWFNIITIMQIMMELPVSYISFPPWLDATHSLVMEKRKEKNSCFLSQSGECGTNPAWLTEHGNPYNKAWKVVAFEHLYNREIFQKCPLPAVRYIERFIILNTCIILKCSIDKQYLKKKQHAWT